MIVDVLVMRTSRSLFSTIEMPKSSTFHRPDAARPLGQEDVAGFTSR